MVAAGREPALGRRLAQAERCTGKHAVACLSLLESGYTLKTPDARVDAAVAIALRSTLESMGEALVGMATLDELMKLVRGRRRHLPGAGAFCRSRVPRLRCWW